jgi:hypothetical protein
MKTITSQGDLATQEAVNQMSRNYAEIETMLKDYEKAASGEQINPPSTMNQRALVGFVFIFFVPIISPEPPLLFFSLLLFSLCRASLVAAESTCRDQ